MQLRGKMVALERSASRKVVEHLREGAVLLDSSPEVVVEFRHYLLKVWKGLLVPVCGAGHTEDSNVFKQLN